MEYKIPALKKYSLSAPKKIRTLCVDLDGVLAKWNSEASVEEVYCEGSRYFLRVSLQRNLRDVLFELYNAGYTIVFLTAYPNSQALEDKKTWVASPVDKVVVVDGIEVHGAGLPMIPVIGVPYGSRKGDFVDERNAVLLDDFGHNLAEWQGVRVKFLWKDSKGNCNNTHGTKYRYSISYDMPTAVITNRLAEYIAHGIPQLL